MSTYATFWRKTRADIERVLSRWDGRPTAALARDRDRDALLWLLWDHAPHFEVWLVVPLTDDEFKKIAAEKPKLISDAVAAAENRNARIEVFRPDVGNSPESISRYSWRLPVAKVGNVEVLAAQELVKRISSGVLDDEPQPMREVLLTVRKAMEKYVETELQFR